MIRPVSASERERRHAEFDKFCARAFGGLLVNKAEAAAIERSCGQCIANAVMSKRPPCRAKGNKNVVVDRPLLARVRELSGGRRHAVRGGAAAWWAARHVPRLSPGPRGQTLLRRALRALDDRRRDGSVRWAALSPTYSLQRSAARARDTLVPSRVIQRGW